jgi:hypothetical protein
MSPSRISLRSLTRRAKRTGLSRAGEALEEKSDLDRLAAEQGVGPVTDFEALLGDFWPENESVDDFTAQVQLWRKGK